MSTTVKMWAVFDPEGDLIVWTTRTQIYNSQESFLKNAFWPYSSIAEMQNASWLSRYCEIIGNIHDHPDLLK